jgi:transposase
MFFERFAIDTILATQTVQGSMGLLSLKWDQTWNIIERAVRRGQARKQAAPLPRVGIDEKSFKKGHRYITMLYDLDNSTVEAISEGNDVDAAKACFSELTQEQIASIEAIAMDMSSAYVKATKETIPLAEEKIVHDRFHVMQLASKALDKIRRGEHRQLLSEGDDRLTKTRYLWLKSQENLTKKQRELFEEVYQSQLETGKAWAFKEMLRDLWNHETAAEATVYFQEWYRRVIHTKLDPMKTVARTIKERLSNVVSYCTHRITNAVAEGMNSKIMSIKRRVGGFRNIENFKTAIFFHCGGLDLYPR